tara:strand:- start:1020 stop:1247 length:228 start_codon:yes stop_codon:yes gene_type:complete
VLKEQKEILEVLEMLAVKDQEILENLAVEAAAEAAVVVFTKKADLMVVVLVNLEVAPKEAEAAAEAAVQEEIVDM